MKKSLLVLTAALSFGVAAAQTAAPASAPQVPALTDVPAGHWAKDAIDKLVSTGIILGYPDGTFRGTQNLTRYEAAVIIARLLDQVKTGEVNPGTMDPETLTALQNAIQELAADLAALGVRVSDLEENAVSRDDFARLEERVEAIALQNGDPEALAGLTSQIDELTARADDYDTLRADVDDNASSIAALNDLTVLLNQDILNLQDRVSAVEDAQANLVARADFDNLAGRVGVVETKVTSIDNRVTQLEKYAFSIKPTLSATYLVGRATRDMDIDRLLPGTVLSTGDDGTEITKDSAVDYADFSGKKAAVLAGAENFYGFSNAGNLPNKAVLTEGSTTINFGITFGSSGKFDTAKSDVTGTYAKGKGGLSVNTVDVNFGIRSGLPSNATAPTYLSGPGVDNVYGTADDVRASVYPEVNGTDGITYRPLFFYFKNATAAFTVGNAPVTVTFGKGLKFKFSDYIGDNDAVGRGDGFNVKIDGSTVPVIGAYKPVITTVYGSRKGANTDNQYYRGVRAEITPVGTLKAGVQVLQEGVDAFGLSQPVKDVTVYGADLHGQVAGWQLDSEYAQSRIAPSRIPGATAGTVETQSAFYAKTSGTLGPVKITDLNYRTISAGYDATAGIMEANPTDTYSTAPYINGRTGFGVKVTTNVGPVALGGYVDNSVDYGKSPLNTVAEPSAIVDRGVAARVSLFNLVTVRGGYYELLTGTNSPLGGSFNGKNGVRYDVRGDVTPGLGISVGAFYRNVANANTRIPDDAKLFSNGLYAATNAFGLTGDDLTTNSCFTTTCYSEYGVEAMHNGKDANALVKDLNLTLGYKARYRAITANNVTTYGYTNNVLYGTADYTTKVGVANVNLKAGFENSDFAANDTSADYTTLDGTVDVKTDPLNVTFKPSFEGYVKGYSKQYRTNNNTALQTYTANDVTYRVGVKLNEFLLPNTKLAVYYAGYQGKNRVYTPYVAGALDSAGKETAGTAGAFSDSNHGRTISQDLVYVEANYYDLSFGYGYGNLRMRDANNVVVPGAADAKGNIFKINYTVKF
ncbi:S-layer homology domain-containing protein [Deinococcus sp.]|uniref:S-layer homology domain-containing protein n=1 Tax=Deinococcus sp. TaxID=47478 RepID=UPI0025B954C9|nr:S-layer homology domain-containing protein [Deinococcus sp.]